MKRNIGKLSIAVFTIAMTFTGCSNKDVQVAELEKQLQNKESLISTQEKAVDAKNAEITSLKKQLQDAQTVYNAPIQNATSNSTSNSTIVADNSSLVPPNAKAGECYAKVLTPEEYTTKTEQKLLTESVEKFKVTEPTYKDVKYKIIDKAESFEYVFTPATYKCVENKVMVAPEKITYKIIPATFKEIEEKVLVSEAHEVWKKGEGPITKIDNHTGEIMCLVKVPAKYKIVKSKVIDEPERVEKVVTPAVYKNIKAKVVDKEASYKKIIIPATYKTITVQEIDKEASTTKYVTDETYQTVNSTYVSKPAELKWERILCQTNTNKNVIKELQQELSNRNYNPGPIDGVYGKETMKALTAFQVDNNLSSGALTLESLDALGIK